MCYSDGCTRITNEITTEQEKVNHEQLIENLINIHTNNQLSYP